MKKRELERKARAELAVKKELQHLRQAAKLANVERCESLWSMLGLILIGSCLFVQKEENRSIQALQDT